MLRFLAPPAFAKARKTSTHEAVIDRLAPKMSNAIRGAALAAQERIDLDALTAGIEAGSVGRVLDMLGLETFVADDLAPTMGYLSEANEAGRRAGISRVRKSSMTFHSFWIGSNKDLVVALDSSASTEAYKDLSITGIDWSELPPGFSRENVVGSVKLFRHGGGAGIPVSYTGTSLEVPAEHQRRGIATALYDHIESTRNIKLTPEFQLTDDGKAFWEARRQRSLPTSEINAPKATIPLDFKTVNPKALAAAQRQAGELLSSVNSETKATVRDLIARAYRDQVTAKDTARLIRDVVGLNDRQANALYNYRAGLVEDGRAADQIERMTAKYGDRLLRQRANTIAQTEIHRASAEGQHELWREGVREGRLNPNTTRRVWIANVGACEWCSGIEELNPEGVPIDGQFETPDGDMIDGPEESHVGCRCSTGLETE